MKQKLNCGMNIDQLSTYSDYRHSGEGMPAAAVQRVQSHCDSCTSCRQYLANLARIDQAAQDLIAPQSQSDFQENWYQQLLDWLRLETQPGQNLPLPTRHPQNSSQIVNGALRALLRHWGSTQQTIVAKTKIEIEENETKKPTLNVSLELLVGYPVNIPEATNQVRQRIKHGIEKHFEVQSGRIDIEVTDLVIKKEQ